MSKGRSVERLQALLSDIASGGRWTEVALGRTNMRPEALGLHGAQRSESPGVLSRTLAALPGGTGSGSLLSASRQVFNVATAHMNAWKQRRRARNFVAATAAGRQRLPAGGAHFHAAAAAEPAAVTDFGSTTGGGGVDAAATAASALAADAYAPWKQQLSVAGGHGPQASAATAADASVCLDGTVQKITFRAADTGYTVMRVQISAPRKGTQPGSPRAGGSSSGSEGSGRESGSEDAGEGATAAAVQLPAALGKKRVITVVGSLPQVGGADGVMWGTWPVHVCWLPSRSRHPADPTACIACLHACTSACWQAARATRPRPRLVPTTHLPPPAAAPRRWPSARRCACAATGWNTSSTGCS